MLLTRILVVVLASVAVGALSGCEKKDASVPEDESNNTEKTGDAIVDGVGAGFEELETKLLTETQPTFPEPVASKTAVHGRNAPREKIVVEVYEVRVREDSTFVSWGVRSSKGHVSSTKFMSHMSGGDLSAPESPPFKYRDYARKSTPMAQLFDPMTETTYWPWQRPVGGGDRFKGCLCSGSPDYLTEEPYLINGLYPKLPDDLETVSFKIPYFPVIENVPVSRD